MNVVAAGHDARMSGLPMRDWNSTAVDPALVFAQLSRAHLLLVRDLEARFADAGLPPFDIARLLWLWSDRNIGLEVREVATRLGLSRPAASRLVARAERAGLVDRRPGLLDAREMSVRVTTRGRATIHRFDAAARAATRELGFDDAELESLGAFTERIVRRAGRGNGR